MRAGLWWPQVCGGHIIFRQLLHLPPPPQHVRVFCSSPNGDQLLPTWLPLRAQEEKVFASMLSLEEADPGRRGPLLPPLPVTWGESLLCFPHWLCLKEGSGQRVSGTCTWGCFLSSVLSQPFLWVPGAIPSLGTWSQLFRRAHRATGGPKSPRPLSPVPGRRGEPGPFEGLSPFGIQPLGGPGAHQWTPGKT